MELRQDSPLSERDQSPDIRVFKKIVQGQPDEYYFILNSEPFPVILTRERITDGHQFPVASDGYTYHFLSYGEEVGVADVHPGEEVICVEYLEPTTGNNTDKALYYRDVLSASMPFFIQALKQDYPEVWTIEDGLGNQL